MQNPTIRTSIDSLTLVLRVELTIELCKLFSNNVLNTLITANDINEIGLIAGSLSEAYKDLC